MTLDDKGYILDLTAAGCTNNVYYTEILNLHYTTLNTLIINEYFINLHNAIIFSSQLAISDFQGTGTKLFPLNDTISVPLLQAPMTSAFRHPLSGRTILPVLLNILSGSALIAGTLNRSRELGSWRWLSATD